MIGRIGTVMGSCVNIAQMSYGRHQVAAGPLTILNVDSLIPDAVLMNPHPQQHRLGQISL